VCVCASSIICKRCSTRRRNRYAPGFGKRGQCGDSAAQAQRRDAAAPNQLLRLREEFDLADAAAAELDVVPGNRDLAAAAMGVDLALDRVNVLNRGEVEMPPPQVRAELGQKGAARIAVTGHRPRLDQRRPLPILPRAFVVTERRLG
jgi:hypothetical protein